MSEISSSIGISVISSFSIFSFLIGTSLSSSFFIDLLVPLPSSFIATASLAVFFFGISQVSSFFTGFLVPVHSVFISTSSSSPSSSEVLS